MNRAVTNEEIRRKMCRDVAQAMRAGEPNLIEHIATKLERIADGEDPAELFLGPPKDRHKKTMRNGFVAFRVQVRMRALGMARRAAERDEARERGMKTGTVRQIINRINRGDRPIR